MYPDITVSILALYNYSPDVFKDFEVPAQIEKQDVIDSILLECCELMTLYPDFATMQLAIKMFSKKRLDAWQRMATALFENYNPLHNFDRFEESNDDETNSSSGDANSVNSVNGYNGDAEHDKQITHGTSNSTRGNKHKAHLYGNIGVTTSAQMLEGELAIRKSDLINIIVREFKENFCIMVY